MFKPHLKLTVGFMTRPGHWAKVILLIGATLTLSQCSNNSLTSVEPTFSSLYTNFFYNNCLTCHQPGGTATVASATLDFTDASTAYTSLRTSVASGITSGTACAGISIINTTTPANSFILAILSTDYYSTDFAGATNCTPYTEHHTNIAISQAFTSNVKTALVEWITQGAQDN